MIAAVKKWVCHWSYSSAKNTTQMCFLSKEEFKNKSIWQVADQKPIFNTTKLEWCCTKVEVYPGKFLRCAPIWPQKSFSISLKRHLLPFLYNSKRTFVPWSLTSDPTHSEFIAKHIGAEMAWSLILLRFIPVLYMM